MNTREIKVAKEFHILEKVQKLELELLNVCGVTKVEFDLYGFYDNLNQVIFLTKYHIPVNEKEYFQYRKQLKNKVLVVARDNGLTRTEDRIEDYGEHFYFVTKCDRSWLK